MIVYLIRHGETDSNKRRLLQGQSDIALNEYGRKLAKLTQKALSNVAFDCVITSPLKRASETADIILGERKVPVMKDDRIQEISFGEYEGLCLDASSYNIPDPCFMNFFNAPQLYNTPPQGEGFADILARTKNFWDELIKNEEYKDKTILVSTHGCALKAILSNIEKKELKDFWGEGVNKNCAITIIKVTDNKTEILQEGKVYY